MANAVHTINPATEDPLETLELDTPERIQRALERADQAYRRWRSTPLATRAELLRALAARLREEEAAHARQVTLEMGKPITQARAEIAKCARACQYFA
ncbi:MAG TPA: aldehyde dehydrogenase family protein, partial [Polyangiaceae bacterium]|nr:aldehyde dehydrogenase family protein [Polyangiaceae bacterium]